MADRRADDTPLASRRSRSGPSPEDSRDDDTGKRPITERVASAVGAAGAAVQSAATSTAPSSAQSSDQSSAQSRSQSTGSTSAVPRTGQARPRGTRRARLRLVHLDPWSVMKTASLLSIAFGIVTVVAVAVVWSVLGAAGVWESINKTVTDVLGGESAQSFDVENYVGTSRVLGFTMLVAVLNVVLITALSTLGAFLYNLAAALLGGVEVTLAEDEH